jgi:uncharacterized protein (DUF433 family)
LTGKHIHGKHLSIKSKEMAMGEALAQRNYPYITTNPEIAGGVPIIEGTRVAVRTIAGYYQMGMSVDEILTTLPHLTPAQIHSALAYYFDHQAIVDADLAKAAEVDFLKEQVISPSRQA